MSSSGQQQSHFGQNQFSMRNGHTIHNHPKTKQQGRTGKVMVGGTETDADEICAALQNFVDRNRHQQNGMEAKGGGGEGTSVTQLSGGNTILHFDVIFTVFIFFFRKIEVCMIYNKLIQQAKMTSSCLLLNWLNSLRTIPPSCLHSSSVVPPPMTNKMGPSNRLQLPPLPSPRHHLRWLRTRRTRPDCWHCLCCSIGWPIPPDSNRRRCQQPHKCCFKTAEGTGWISNNSNNRTLTLKRYNRINLVETPTKNVLILQVMQRVIGEAMNGNSAATAAMCSSVCSDVSSALGTAAAPLVGPKGAGKSSKKKGGGGKQANKGQSVPTGMMDATTTATLTAPEMSTAGIPIAMPMSNPSVPTNHKVTNSRADI